MLSSIPCHAVIVRNDQGSVINKISLSSYLFRIRRFGININGTHHFLGFKQNNRNILLCQVRRSLRTLTTLGSLRYGCVLTQRLELCLHSSLRMLKVFNGNHDIPVLRLTNLTRRLCAFRVHGYMICTWF